MSTISIVMLICGILSLAMAIFGKLRPDIVWKNNLRGTIATHERQKFGMILFILVGIMFILISVVLSVPQWQPIQDAIVLAVVFAMTIVMMFPFWKYVLSSIEGFRTIGLVFAIVFSLALIAFCMYYWHLTLK